MVRILVFQHVAWELLGTLNPHLKSHGVRIRYVNFEREPQARPTLEGYHGLVVLGGPMSVDDVDRHPHLATEQRAIGEALERGLPILGICLGAQLLARALGAGVRPGKEKEIGWYDVELSQAARDDPLFAHFGPRERIFQWHGDVFDLPEGAVHLASSPACPNQAFRWGDSAYGFQFHLEADRPMIERWLGVPAHREEIEGLDGRVDPEAIRRETPERMPRIEQLSDRTFEAFVALLGRTRRRPDHPHGR
ncbi:MAG: gamma-glutamyl-gamma-aminobutyrate hydrolase family protein [Myxococcota bacterium]|nr:gamma-glutamyl-gamma-aminobutyrate hydrolase family protein [Myxococcota bacterium]